jgi:hypothetical protein
MSGMDLADILRFIVLLTSTGVLASAGNWHSASSGIDSWLQGNATNVNQAAASSGKSRTFSNQFLTIAISPGWTAHPVNQILDITRGKYILSINPMFTHARNIGGFFEIAARMPSVDAVMRHVDQPAGGWECSQTERMTVSSTISGSNYYTDKSKTGSGCTFPLDPRPAWFGSFFGDRSSESEHNITLSYDTADVSKLPKRNSQELRGIFRDVVAMLKTLRLKPPLVITKVDPETAAPGATVTIYGRGFAIPNYHASLIFKELPNDSMPEPITAPDGNSMTFQVPSSINTISCQPGYIQVDEDCVPTPADHVDINDCPQSAGFCGIPISPRTYHIMVNLEGTGVITKPVAFTVDP